MALHQFSPDAELSLPLLDAALATLEGYSKNIVSDAGGNVAVAGGTLNIGRSAARVGLSTYCRASALSTGADWVLDAENSAASSPFGINVIYTGAAPNGTGSQFFSAIDTGGQRFAVRSNGGIANYSANNVNLSDERVKTDFQPAPDYYTRWLDIDFCTFLYRDQTDTQRNLGVRAQQLRTVFPELVDDAGFGETPADGVPLMAVYQTDFSYAVAVALQQAIRKIEALSQQVAALQAGSA